MRCYLHDVFEIVGLPSGAPRTPASPPNQNRCPGFPGTVFEYDQDCLLPSRLVTVQVALHFFGPGPSLVAWISKPLSPLPVMLHVNVTC